jgi:N,N-dimethylformamidase
MQPLLTGYCDPLVAAPGDTLTFMLSGPRDAVAETRVVRLSHGFPSVKGPGVVETEVDGLGAVALAEQCSDIGSYAFAPGHPAFDVPDWTIRLFAMPTRFAPQGQALFAKGDLQLWIDAAGRPFVSVAGVVRVTGAPLVAGEWAALAVSFASSGAILSLHQHMLRPGPADREIRTASDGAAASLAAGDVLIAGAPDADGDIIGRFDGKIDLPAVMSRAFAAGDLDPRAWPAGGDVVAAWNLGYDPAGCVLHDAGRHAIHGRFVQQPSRAVTGCLWSAEEVDWRLRPEEYSAAHFHSDDLEDIGWNPSVRWTVPADLPSGIYALRVDADGQEDRIPFFVRPAPGTASARIAFLAPTYSYLAYANERTSHELDFNEAGMTDRTIRYHRLDDALKSRPDFGVSMYDHHSDGSGVCYASSKRPLLNLRPDYFWWLSGGPQYVSVDLCIIHWLETLGEAFDTITDHDLDDEGLALLGRYDVVVTSAHPEYYSKAMLDALDGFTRRGGRLFYMGGNGFYWVTTRVPDRPWMIEVRRGFSGNRAWESEPGEEHHASTGERGGLWRRRGRTPNSLVGIGFSAQGWDVKARGYRLSEQAGNVRASWIFDGVGGDYVGDFGLIMDGAAGDELDRADISLGTPRHALILGSSGEHSRYYLVCQEDALFSHNMMGGDVNPNVRADLCFFETAGGGAVFSVGSKAWAGSLSHKDYDNDVARISTNVLRGFLDRDFVWSGQ